MLKIASIITSHLIEGPQQITIPPLDEVENKDTVPACRSLQFSTYISPSAAVSTISDLTQSSASYFAEIVLTAAEGEIEVEN